MCHTNDLGLEVHVIYVYKQDREEEVSSIPSSDDRDQNENFQCSLQQQMDRMCALDVRVYHLLCRNEQNVPS